MHNDSAVALIQIKDILAARHLEAVAAAIAESQRPSTRKAYTAAWKRFQAWAQREGVPSLPAEPVTVAAYLVHRDAVGLSLATLAMDRKAISYFHRRAGIPTPTASEGVKMAIAGVRNRAAERGGPRRRQARGLREAELKAITDTAHIPRVYPSGRMESPGAARTRGAVDIAIVSVMRDALLRRQEAADLRWSDVEFRADRSSRVTIRRSKTSNKSAVLYLGVRATAALKRIRPDSPIPGARVFGVRRGRTISARIATVCREAGLGDGFSGHSPRVGMAQDLAAHGTGLVAIMNAGRWKSERMPAYYSRGEAAGMGAVARYYGGIR
ncbi:MAG: tyrosine-type recombinase/integrase [Gemmatimonadetes bacterium]|nr:tyrosine-type recombinase/integrase [Gemmatimonadota bacterium]